MLSAKQNKCIQYVLTTKSYKEAIQKADVKEATFYQWLRENQEFKDELSQRINEVNEAAMNQIIKLTNEAVRTLADAMDKDQDINVRLRAAKIVLENNMKYKDLVEFERRLSELEHKIRAGEA